MNSIEMSAELLKKGSRLEILNKEIDILNECLRNSHLSYVRYYNNTHSINIDGYDRSTFRILMEIMIENRKKEILDIMSKISVNE